MEAIKATIAFIAGLKPPVGSTKTVTPKKKLIFHVLLILHDSELKEKSTVIQPLESFLLKNMYMLHCIIMKSFRILKKLFIVYRLQNIIAGSREIDLAQIVDRRLKLNCLG